MFESIFIDQPQVAGARIKVIGVGGCGGNAVNNLVDAGLPHIEFLVANTDAQALANNLAATKLQIGAARTSGLGAGGDPSVGHGAALDDIDSLRQQFAETDMVFITAGMGGGTGTGAAPVVAQAARDAGALTVAVVTKPFSFEGRQRIRQAEEGMRELAAAVDTLIVIPNDRIFEIANPRIPVKQAFRMVDSVVVEAVRGISDMIAIPGLVNVDFADVKAIMKGKGVALMGTGRGMGEERAILAAKQAISSPLLEDARIEGATGLLVTITGNQDMSLADIHDAMNLIQDATGADTNTIFGAIFDDAMGEEIKVTVVATGFDRAAAVRHHESQTARLYNATRSTTVATQPPPAPRQAQLPAIDEVPVYAVAAAAHDRAATVAVSMPQPLAHSGHAHVGLHHADTQPLPTRPATASMWGLPSQEHEFEQPAYLRRTTPGYGVPQVPGGSAGKREPVVHNPFAATASELDCPAFRRK